MEKVLLLLACLLGPAIWGWLVNEAFLRSWPAHRQKGPERRPEEEIEPAPTDAEAPPAETWDFQI